MEEFYQILELEPGVSAGELRTKYLALVREFPPEKAPERFAEIHAAYERITGPMEFLENELLTPVSGETFDAVRDSYDKHLEGRRFSAKTLLELGKER